MTDDGGIFWRWVGRQDGLGKAHLAATVYTDDRDYALRGPRDRVLTACDGYGPGFGAHLGPPARTMDPCAPCFETWDRLMTELVATTDEARP